MRMLAAAMFAANGRQIPADLLEVPGESERADDEEELPPGIRPASVIEAELQRAVAAVKGR